MYKYERVIDVMQKYMNNINLVKILQDSDNSDNVWIQNACKRNEKI